MHPTPASSRALALGLLLLAACGGASPSPAARMLSDQGAAQLVEGRLDEAEASLRLALELAPADAPAHANLGLVLLSRGDLPGAEAALRGAILVDEDLVEAWSSLAVVLEREGRDDDAQAAYERALSINPTRPEPRLGLSRLLVRRGQPVPARAHLLRLAALLPDDPETLGLLAWTELRLERPLVASELVVRAASIDPDAVAPRFVHALLEARRGALAVARAELALLESDPVLGHDACLRIAAIDVLGGALAVAHARVDRLLDEDPFDPAVRLVAATLAREEGQHAAAIAHAREARTLEPELEPAWLLEAEGCARTGERGCVVHALAHVRSRGDATTRERARIATLLDGP